MPETPVESPGNALANTRLTDRELLIHAVQHLEELSRQVTEIYEALTPLRPLLGKLSRRKALFP